MFPDTGSLPTETRVLMGSIRLRRGWVLLAWCAVALFSATALYSLFQMDLLGLRPASAAGELPAIIAYSAPYEPSHLTIPVTGLLSAAVPQQQTFVDDFSMNTGDWNALQGSIRYQDQQLVVSPRWLGEGGTAGWNLPQELVGSSFTFSADLTSTAKAWQRFGLALNLQPDGSGLLFIIEPDTGKAAAAWRYSTGVTYLVPWQSSPGVLPAPTPNRVEIRCSPSEISLSVNGVESIHLPPPLPCNQGQLGVFVLTPSQPVSVDNAALDLLKQ